MTRDSGVASMKGGPVPLDVRARRPRSQWRAPAPRRGWVPACAGTTEAVLHPGEGEGGLVGVAVGLYYQPGAAAGGQADGE